LTASFIRSETTHPDEEVLVTIAQAIDALTSATDDLVVPIVSHLVGIWRSS
jgi:hypothetical protein